MNNGQPHRNVRLAVRLRAQIVQELGGVCVRCGQDDPEELQLDHIRGRDWVLNRVSSDQRARRLRQEATEGKLQVLCAACNKAKQKEDRERLPEEAEA